MSISIQYGSTSKNNCTILKKIKYRTPTFIFMIYEYMTLKEKLSIHKNTYTNSINIL